MKVENGIIGFVVGDIMGVPVEFNSREKLLLNPVTEMLEYGTHNMPKGCWSDDTSMTLATMDSIIKCKEINTNDMADKFIKWYRNGEYTATGIMFDIGTTIQQALVKYQRGIGIASKCGGEREYDNGNGSLMRMLPIAYYCYLKGLEDTEILKIVKEVSSITHRHPISILGCYIYVRLAIELLKGKGLLQAYQEIKKLDYSYFTEDTIYKYERILNNDIGLYNINEISSNGYIVSTLEAVIWTLINSKSFNETIIKAINLGEDTDTVGACVGGLAGIYYGIENIKQKWKDNILRYDYIINMCKEFEKI